MLYNLSLWESAIDALRIIELDEVRLILNKVVFAKGYVKGEKEFFTWDQHGKCMHRGNPFPKFDLVFDNDKQK